MLGGTAMNLRSATLSTLVFQFAFTAFGIASPAQADEAQWERSFENAEKAYARRDLWSARKEFIAALKDAKQSKQDSELARRVESLAGTYQSQDKDAMAEPLFKLARKLKSRSSCI